VRGLQESESQFIDPQCSTGMEGDGRAKLRGTVRGRRLLLGRLALLEPSDDLVLGRPGAGDELQREEERERKEGEDQQEVRGTRSRREKEEDKRRTSLRRATAK